MFIHRRPPYGGFCLAEGRIWQHRFYDFVVFTEKKRVQKVRYRYVF
ncbi:MAG TPA: hypothetical protein VH088_13990 [Terriglobales bacterium]|nr:hypothetical protein [Terriglobales bacterium]